MITITGLVLLVVGLVLGAPLVAIVGGLALAAAVVLFAADSADSGTKAHYW